MLGMVLKPGNDAYIIWKKNDSYYCIGNGP